LHTKGKRQAVTAVSTVLLQLLLSVQYYCSYCCQYSTTAVSAVSTVLLQLLLSVQYYCSYCCQCSTTAVTAVSTVLLQLLLSVQYYCSYCSYCCHVLDKKIMTDNYENNLLSRLKADMRSWKAEKSLNVLKKFEAL